MLRRMQTAPATSRKRGGSPNVLLVDAGERSAVAACRCLAAAGYRVGTASSERPAPAEWSRFSSARHRLPSPRADGRQFSEQLAEIAAGEGYRTALACSEGALWAMSEHREPLEQVLDLGLPAAEIVAECTDKSHLIEQARAAGLKAPETVVCDSSEEAFTAARRIGFPLVLKPPRTVFTLGTSTEHRATALVADESKLRPMLARIAFPCLVQRRETGAVVSIGGVFAGGSLLAATMSRYLRTRPLAGGPVSYSRSEEPPATLLESIECLLGALGWEGIFELELIETADGGLAVLDFNPRIYGSLALAVRAGTPLPAIWCDWLLKGERSAPRLGKAGVHYRWEDADLRNALGLLRGNPRRALSLLRPRSPTAHAFLRWDDPAPALVRALRML